MKNNKTNLKTPTKQFTTMEASLIDLCKSISPLFYTPQDSPNYYQKDVEFLPSPSFDHTVFPDRLQLKTFIDESGKSRFFLSSIKRDMKPKIISELIPTVYTDWYYGTIINYA
ncbi:MAG: hypothetical protein LPJ98_06545 [Cyclobacteriaceae bacterium]|nr:hypothetical protein [Cyclobacteriaceae bacterium]